ncbi:YbaY family lipoprotein [Shewanella waksmanii]|uniref:YbaY family lipoprotein n=1 Tax=Shewanella waksmanii TaxID=213783 RepID=UPI003736802E
MKKWLTPVVSTLMVTSILAGCATPKASVEIQGEVWYKERIALPPQAVLTVQVKDVSLMDAPAVVIAEIERSGVTTPAPFEFVINRDQFESGHTYAVGAKITVNGELMFINTQAYNIDIANQQPLSVLVQKVGATR